MIILDQVSGTDFRFLVFGNLKPFFWLFSAGICDSFAKLKKKKRNWYRIFLVEWLMIKVM